ncbi:MAG: TRAP transporter small permease subunit, partial [Pseudomonadota bacterium]
MIAAIHFIDRLTSWFGRAFAWCILIMTFGVAYEVFSRYLFGAPTAWAFDLSYMMYGALFMMGGAYALATNAHVRGDFLYRLWSPRWQGRVELVLYILEFFHVLIVPDPLVVADRPDAAEDLRNALQQEQHARGDDQHLELEDRHACRAHHAHFGVADRPLGILPAGEDERE